MSCDIKTRLINTLKDEIRGNSSTYKTEDNRIFIPANSNSKFYSGLAQAFKLANTKVNRINNKYSLWSKGDVVSVDNSSKEGVYINIHPTQSLIDAYTNEEERKSYENNTTLFKGNIANDTTQEVYDKLKERLFKGETISTSGVILNILIESSKAPYIKKLADILNRYNHNNVPVKLLSQQEANEYIKNNDVKLYNNLDASNIAGFYNVKNNEIVIVDKPNKNIEADVEHEVVHALTFHFLESNEEFAKQFGKIFKETKELFTGSEHYQFKNVHEFLTGILTDSGFQKLLSTKKANSNYFSNKWEEIKDTILSILTKYLGLDFQEYTLFEHLLDKALDVVEASATYSENSVESNWENYALTAISNEQKEEIKESTKKYAEILASHLTKEQLNKRISWFYKQFDANLRSLTKSKEFAEQRALYTDEISGTNTYVELTRRLSTVGKDVSESNYELRVRAMAEAISTTRKLIDVTFDNIKKIAVDKDNAKENIKTLYNYTRLLNTYEKSLESVRNLGDDSPHEMFSDVVDSLDKIKRARTFIINNDQTGIIQLLKENAVNASERSKEYYADIIIKQKQALIKAEKNNDFAKAREIKAQIKSTEEQITKYDLQNVVTISNWLKGKYGDQNRFSMLLDSYRDATDPVLGTFVNYVNSLKQQVKQYQTRQRTTMDSQLNPHYKALGYGMVDYERLWGQLTFADKRLGKDGNIEKVLAFLSPYKDYQYDRDLFNKQITDLRALRDSGNVIDKSSMKQELLDDVETLEEKIKNKIDFDASTKKWNSLTQPYNIQDQLKAKYLQRALWESKYMVRDKTPNYYETYDKLYNDEIGAELKVKREEIFSKLNIYNSLQEEGLLSSEDKSEQDVLWDEYFALSNLYKIDGTQKEGIDLAIAKRAQEIAQANREHYDYHVNTKAFNRDRDAYSEKLIAQYGEDSDDYKTKMAQWEKDNTRTVIKQEYYNKREKLVNELNAYLKLVPSSELRAEKMSEYYKEIIGQIYGLRDDDGQPIGSEITEDRAARIKELQEKIEDFRERFSVFSGLSDEDSARLAELFDKKSKGLSSDEWKEYTALQDKSKKGQIPKETKTKIISLFEQLKNMSSRIPTSYYISAFNDASELKIDEEGKLNGKDILESDELPALLENAEFKKWWDKNHFISTKYNPLTKEKEKTWQRLYQWSKVIPTDVNMSEVLPSRNYTYRVVKPKYETNKIVGITTDNKGNFLPRLDATDRKYINEDYFKLVNSKEKALSSILEIAKVHHLENQELANSYNDKLWLDVPRIRKGSLERNIVIAKSPIEFAKEIPGRLKSKYKSLEEYSSGTGNAPIEGDDELDFLETGISGRRSSIPVAYTTRMDINDVSRDVRKAILSYGGSLKSSQVLKEALPFAEALREIYKKPIEEKKKYKFWETKNNRLNALEYYINRDFFGVGKAYEIGEGADRVFIGIKSLAIIKFLGSNISSIITNLGDGVNQNIINAGHGKFSRADYFKSLPLFSQITGNAFKDFFDETLGKYSVSTQLLEAFEPVSEGTVEEGLTHGKSKARWALSLDVITGNRAKTEFWIQARIYAAYMYAQKVGLNEETIPLSEAYELDPDGIVKLKSGVDKAWDVYTGSKFIQLKNDIQKSVRDLQGAYAKEDRTFLDQYTLFSFVVTLKRFFLRKVINQFGSSGVDFSWKAGLSFKPRYNQNSGADLGFALSMVNGLSRQMINKEFNFSLMTKQEKADSIRFLVQLGSIAALSILAYGLYGGGDQKDKFAEIDNLSDSEAYFLYQVLRLKTETETLLSPTQYKSFIFDISAATIFADWTNLLKDFVTQEEYKKDSGINKKGDKKWIKDVEQLTGVYSIMKLGSPKDMAKNYEKALNSKAK